MNRRTRTFRLRAAALLLCVPPVAGAAPLFEDNFDTDTSANWTIRTGQYKGQATDDYSAEWGVDYSQLSYKLYTNNTDFEEFPVPPAPSGSGATRALKLAVNKKDATPARMAINLYPNGKSFSGDYVVSFDLFMNHSAYLANGVGTTEYTLFGINHSGDYVNWFALSGANLRADFVTDAVGGENSDGLFFGVTGDGGAARDYVAIDGGGTGRPPVPKLSDESGGLLDRNGDGVIDTDNGEGYFRNVFPGSLFEGTGVLGKRWVRVEISQVANVVTWKIDGHIMARRVNETAFHSGNLMIGYADPFDGIADPPDENYALIDNLRVDPVRTVVVDTTDNNSPAGDGKTSLKEALADLQDHDRITFNIPGAGPHVIATPIGGYPLITESDVVIDGYTQPGSSPNTQGILEGNNAQLRIVLDSSSEATGPNPANPALPLRASTRLPYPGYGDSENAILGILAADRVTVRGLSFKSRHTSGSDEDPAIYCVALVNGAENARVQGCWFGLAPDGTTVSGSASAVAAFRHRVSVDGNNVDTFSGGLIFGTDSDGRDDRSEANIACGMHIALALELPRNRTAGNYFNVRADGRSFVNVNEIHEAQLAAGREVGDSSVENYENGRQTDFTVIGTDGNGVNDANERNIFNTVVYDHLIEFYSNAQGAIIAGNYFGVGVDGTTTPPKAELKEPNLIELPGTATVRLGTNGDGVSDDVEGNVAVNIPGTQMLVSGATSPITARGNRFSGNGFTGFPFADGSGRNYETYYADVLVTPTSPQPAITKFENNLLSGTLPAINLDNYPAGDVVDLYVIDPLAEAAGNLIPGRYLGTFTDNGTNDVDMNFGAFTVDLTPFNVPSGSKITIVATYLKDTGVATEAGRSVTGPPAPAFQMPGQPSEPVRLGPISRGANHSLTLTWTGGPGPYTVQRRASVASGAWENLLTTDQRTATINADGEAGFVRIATP